MEKFGRGGRLSVTSQTGGESSKVSSLITAPPRPGAEPGPRALYEPRRGPSHCRLAPSEGRRCETRGAGFEKLGEIRLGGGGGRGAGRRGGPGSPGAEDAPAGAAGAQDRGEDHPGGRRVARGRAAAPPPPGDRWGRRATPSPPPPPAACREPEPLPVAPGFRTPTPVGPRENRSGDGGGGIARALPGLVVRPAAALRSRQRGRAGSGTTEAKVRVAGRGQSAPAWGWR